MPKYLLRASYTADGIRGLLKDGGTARREAVEKAARDVGGTVESFHFAFGGDDAYVLMDLPDNVTAAALSASVGSSGMVRIRTVPLLTTEEMDKAVKKSVGYRAPGK
jgi:uncharacterized protein with GYD domain